MQIDVSACPNFSKDEQHGTDHPLVPQQLRGAHLHPLFKLGARDKEGKLFDEKSPRVKWGVWEEGISKSDERYGVCLTRSRLLGVDVDEHGVSGNATLAALIKEHRGEPFNTFTVATPSGGFHYYFKLPEGLTLQKKANLWPCVDVFPENQQLLGPGTSRTMPDGSIGYYKVVNDVPVAEVPEWFLKLLFEVQEKEQAAAAAAEESRQAAYDRAMNSFSELSHEMVQWERDALQEACARISVLPKGNRNEPMGSEAFKIGAKLGARHRAEALPLLIAAGIASGHEASKAEDRITRSFDMGTEEFQPRASQLKPMAPASVPAPVSKKQNSPAEVGVVVSPGVKPGRSASFVPQDADYSSTKIEESIEKIKMLETATNLAKVFASSHIPVALWKDKLSGHLLKVVDGRSKTPKFSEDEIGDAIRKGVERSSSEFDAQEKYFTDAALTRKRAALKLAKKEAADAKGVPTADRMTPDDLTDFIAPKVEGKLVYIPELDERRTCEADCLWIKVDNEATRIDSFLSREFRSLRDTYTEMGAKQELDIVSRYMNKRERKVIISTLANDPSLQASAKDFLMEASGIAVDGGEYFDFESGAVRKLAPEDHFTAAAARRYVPNKRDPRIDVLLETFPPDARQYVLELFALSITTKAFKEAYFIEGPPDSGKTKLATLHRFTFEPFVDFTSNSVFSTKNSSKPEDRNVVFLGRRGSFIDELPESGELDEAHFKSVIGTTILTARFLYGQADQHQVWFTLIVLTNHAPRFFEPDAATKNRVVVIPTELRYCDNPVLPNERPKNKDVDDWIMDPDLQTAWLSLMLETAVKVQKHGLSPRPQSVIDKTAAWAADVNPFIDDMDSLLVKSDNEEDFVVLSDLAEEINSYKSEGQHKITSNGLKNKFEKAPELTHKFGQVLRPKAYDETYRSLPPYLKRVKERVWDDNAGRYKESTREPSALPQRVTLLRGVRFKSTEERIEEQKAHAVSQADEYLAKNPVEDSPAALVETHAREADFNGTVELDDDYYDWSDDDDLEENGAAW